MRMNRRAFVTSMITVAAARVVKGQLPPEMANLWGTPVIDCHFHPRPTLEANLAHLNGSGCQAAYLLARLTAADDAKRFMAQEPARRCSRSGHRQVAADRLAWRCNRPYQRPCTVRDPLSSPMRSWQRWIDEHL